MAVQGGKIVAVGQDGSGFFDDFALARYNPNGSLDTSFSGDGKQTTDFGGDNDRATGVALQGNGKIVAVGDAANAATTRDFALARYNPDGTLDPSFSGDGRQTAGFRGGANGVALQGNNSKIVAVGNASDALSQDFALARFNPNGTLDPSFSGDGKQRTNFGGLGEGAAAMALQDNGKIVAVGHAGAHSSDFALARYNPNGSLDTSFSGDGKQTTGFGDVDRAAAVALQDNGKIVVVGHDGSHFALARFNPNGTLDPSFSGDGKQTTAFGGHSNGATGVAIQGDGKIVAVGDTVTGTANFALARYNPNGSLDTSFSGDGKQTTDFGDVDRAAGVALQGGKIVAVGRGGPGSDFELARYNPNGSLDTSFSGDGKQTTNFGAVDGATGVALQGGGRIVAVGGAGPGSDFALARYNLNGSLDPSFSGDGKQTTDFGGSDGATGVALEGGGKIVAVGGGALPLRARPLQLQRVARRELLGRRQADDRLRGGQRPGKRGGGPGRQDRRGRARPGPQPNRRFRACSLSGGLSHARVEARRGQPS